MIIQRHHAGQFSAASAVATTHKKNRQELMEKWQVLGLPLMMLSQTNEDFYDFFKQEFGNVWDGKGWVKEVSYPTRVYIRKSREGKKPR